MILAVFLTGPRCVLQPPSFTWLHPVLLTKAWPPATGLSPGHPQYTQHFALNPLARHATTRSRVTPLLETVPQRDVYSSLLPYLPLTLLPFVILMGRWWRRSIDSRWATSSVAGAVPLETPEDPASPSTPCVARLRVANLHCELEARLVNDTLLAMEGVKKVMINAISRLVIVQYDAQCVQCMGLVDALNSHHLGCTIQGNGEEVAPKKRRLYGALSGLYFAAQTALVVAIAYCLLFPLPNPKIVQYLMMGYLGFGSPPVILKALVGLKERRPDLGLLVLMAVGGAIALHDIFDAVLVTFLFNLSNAFEAWSLRRVGRLLEGLHGRQTPYAILAEPTSSGETAVPVDSVEVGTLLRVRAGEHIPLDGVMEDGAAGVDESAVTGESIPVAKGPGAILYGGSVVQTGFLVMRTTGTFATSTLSKIQAVVQEAQAQASPTALLVDRFARVYTAAIIGIAGTVMLVPALLGFGPVEIWLHTGLLVLILACPCSMVMATPIATVCAIATAAQSQVLIKTGGSQISQDVACARHKIIHSLLPSAPCLAGEDLW